MIRGLRRRLRPIGLFLGGGVQLGLRALSAVAPRARRRWVFGSRNDLFVDHPAHLFEDVLERHPEVDPVWITGDRGLARRLRSAGRPAHHRWSPRGVVAALRAGVVVYAADARDVNFALTGGAVHLNLYHGVPLKEIEFDISVGPSVDVYHPRSPADVAISRVVYAAKWARHDVFAVTSPWVEQVVRTAFDGRIDECVGPASPRMVARPGGPRADVFRDERAVVEELSRSGERILLYVPTWRRSGWRLEQILPDLDRLEAVLAAQGVQLVVKQHLYDGVRSVVRPHLRVVDSRLDATPLLEVADGVVTDYSSILFDAALLQLPVIFVPYDLDEYRRTESRRFTIDYDVLTAGRAASTPDELLDVLADDRWTDWLLPPDLVDQVWGDASPASLVAGNDLLIEAALASDGRGTRR